ncbi:MAG: YciI-like protein [Kofleriaceae bacterium]|nr:YciI-like protein [Kofleriaceae bacterium]
MRYFALVYHVVDDYVSRRGAYREEHLALARAAHARGELLLAGAFTDPPDTALLVWRCADTGPVEAFVAADPYVKNGLVARHEIRDWKVVVADQPLAL